MAFDPVRAALALALAALVLAVTSVAMARDRAFRFEEIAEKVWCGRPPRRAPC